MTPVAREKFSKEHKIKQLLTLAQRVADELESDLDGSMIYDEIRLHLETLPISSSSNKLATSAEIDRAGTHLWNLSTRFRRTEAANGTTTSIVRILKVALKAAKFCMDNGELELGLKALERAALYESQLVAPEAHGTHEHASKFKGLRGEYYQLRTALAWKQSRLDLAEHMYSKIKREQSHAEPRQAESLADLLYEIGHDLVQKGQFEMAVKWLERSYDALAECDLSQLGRDAGELKLSITQSLVRGLKGLQNSESTERAWSLVVHMETEHGERLVVHLLKLELLAGEADVDSEKYCNVLLRIVRFFVLTDGNFKTILYHIYKLKNINEKLALNVLDEFIDQRLLKFDNEDWLEKAVITRLWLTSGLPGNKPNYEAISHLLDRVSAGRTKAFSLPTSHAAQTLLWKRIEACFNQAQYEEAELWCRLSLHPLYGKSGEVNKAKISRKLILCALARQDYASAREAFHKMSEQGQGEALTRYLMYKVAVRNADNEFAAECLESICQHSTKDISLLYACILEAQQNGDRRQTISALLKLLDEQTCGRLPEIHLPALLRCAIKLLVQEFEAGGKVDQQLAREITAVFDGAVSRAKHSKKTSSSSEAAFSPAELGWFSKNGYNVALKYCADIAPEVLGRLIRATIQFIELLAKEGSNEDELALRQAYCNFLAAAISLTLAGADDTIENSAQHYVSVRKHSKAFRDIAEAQLSLNKLSEAAKEDLLVKHLQTVRYELEAALKLSDWDSLEDLFMEAWKYMNPVQLDSLADLALVVHANMTQERLDSKYQAKVLEILQKIISLSWQDSGNDVVKLARWIRCLFQISLTFDERVSLQCLDRATEIATKLRCQNTSYPSEEIEWLAATSFNRAVDFYCASDDLNCRTWAEKSLALAAVAGLGIGLHKLLTEKYGELK